MRNSVLVIIINIFLLLFCIFSSSEFLTEYASLLYLAQFFVFVQMAYLQENNLLVFLSPSFITITYVSLNFIFGHYAVVNALGFDDKYFYAYESYASIKFITFYFLISNLIVFLFIPFKRLGLLNVSLPDVSSNKLQKKSLAYLMFLFVVLFLFGRIEISLGAIGGVGKFNYAFEFATAIAIVLVSRNRTFKERAIIYLVLLVIFITSHFDSKREILFLLILLIIVEVIKLGGKIKLKLKSVLVSSIIAFIFVYIIVLSSILRGYGGYNVEDPVDAIGYVDDYLTSDIAKDALTMNFEVVTVYGNSTNAVDYVFRDEVDLLYGSTFYKLLFVPIPRSINPNKPKSMVDIYTDKFAPSFRAIGGSLPILLYSEVFWNFHIFGLIFLGLIFYVSNKMYVKVIGHMVRGKIGTMTFLYLFLYSTFIQFVRGAGIEMWLIYAFLPLPLIVLYKFLFVKSSFK